MIETYDFSSLSTRGGATPESFFEWRQRAFPFFERKVFLTHASVSHLPAHSRDALTEYSSYLAELGQFDHVTDALYHSCKQRLARLLKENQLNATPDEIAFASSTSHAIGLVATSIDWKPGDNCVVADGDFPANVVVWKNLAHTDGVEVRTIPFRPKLDVSLDDIKPLVDGSTRVVSLASCNFLSGFPPNLKEIGAWLHEREVLLCVDAIQTLGAVRCDFSEVDFICADAHKWILGPNGIALLWTRPEVLKDLRPAILGWLATDDRDHWFHYDTTPIANAERFEPGARNYLGIIACDASLEVLQTYDAETIENRVVALRDFAAQKLAESGFEVLWEPDADLKSGIVSFRAASNDATYKLYKNLDQNFALSIRKDKFGDNWIRISAHFMNCKEDLEQLCRLTKS